MLMKIKRKSNHKRQHVRRFRHLELLEDRRLLATDLDLGDTDVPMITEYDLATGESQRYPAPARDPLLELEADARVAGFEGLVDLLKIGTPSGPYDPMDFDPEIDSLTGPGPETIFGADGRTRINPTTGFPWRSIGLTASTYAGTPGWSWCSAAVIGPFHILTAAHCVRTATTAANPNTFASSLEFVAGSNGVRFSTSLDPDNGTQSTDRPYGTANATFFRAYTWNNSSWDYDIAMVTLDRRIGNFTGWMGYGWNTNDNLFLNQTMNSAGYPGDLNDTNSDGQRDTQYMFHSADPITSVTTHQLRSNQLDIMPGNSGGPLWRFVSSPLERTIYAVTSHQNSSYNGFTRITQDKFDNLIVAGMNTDLTVRPPTDRADLVDWDRWHNSNTAFMNSSFTVPGGNFSVTAYPRNIGTAATGNYSVSFYASTNTTISTSDYFLGSVNMGALAPFNWATANLNVAFPTNVPSGNYYIGWILDSGNNVSEFLEGNNTGYISTNQLTVGSDDHGNNAATATRILAGSNTFGNLEVPGDKDWFLFEAEAGAQITLATTLGTLADSVLRLYASDGITQIGFDDDGGPGFASLLEHTIATRGLYYASVEDFGNNDPGTYWLSLTHADDHGNSAGSATFIGAATTTNGNLEVGGDYDWFQFRAMAGAQITLATQLGTLPDSILRLYDVDGTTELAFNDDFGGTLASRIDYVIPVTGNYFVRVEDFGTPNPGTYTLMLSHVDDHADSAAAATLIGVNSGVIGNTEVGLDVDYFRFMAQAGAAYTLRTNLITHPDTTLTLYDVNGTSVLAFNDDFGGTLASRIDWVAPATGQYYVGVRGFSSHVGAYELVLEGPGGPSGDFNGDGIYDVHDIDGLIGVIAAGTHNPAFDLTGDGLVNLADRNAWLAIAGGINLGTGRVYRLGDANLDSFVDGQDFLLWNQHKFTATPRWSAGDFNGDGVVDGQDFITFNENKFTSADDLSRLPGLPTANAVDLEPELEALKTPINLDAMLATRIGKIDDVMSQRLPTWSANSVESQMARSRPADYDRQVDSYFDKLEVSLLEV